MYVQGERTVCRIIQEYSILKQISDVVSSVILLDVLVNLLFKEHTAGFEDLCKRVVRMIKTM